MCFGNIMISYSQLLIISLFADNTLSKIIHFKFANSYFSSNNIFLSIAIVVIVHFASFRSFAYSITKSIYSNYPMNCR
jgi:hypothetical protein